MSLRILHVCARFSAPSETFIYAMLKAQDAAALDVHVATFDRAEKEQRPFPNVHVLPTRPVWHPARLAGRIGVVTGSNHPLTYTWPDLRGKLEGWINHYQPDLLHAHFGPMGVFCAPVAVQTDRPLVTSFYGYDASQRAADPYWQNKYADLWETGTLFIALSADMKERLVNLGASRPDVRIVHLARDLDAYRFIPPTGRVRHLVCVARMTEKKGHLDLIQAVAQVRSQVSDIRLTLVGDGPCRSWIEQAIHDYGLRDCVDLVGWQPSNVVRDYLASADAFVLCSKTAPGGDREGTPTVLVEAQAAGLPVVSTQHAGIPEMIPKENHRFLAPEGAPGEVAQRILTLCRSSEADLARIAQAGRAKVERSYNIAHETKRVVRLYQDVCLNHA